MCIRDSDHREREGEGQMTTATATQDTKTAPHAKRRARNSKRWGSARTYIFAAVIVIWCLLPAYWMVVTAFRDVGFTYDATPFFSHVTLDNFRAAFSTDTGLLYTSPSPRDRTRSRM